MAEIRTDFESELRQSPEQAWTLTLADLVAESCPDGLILWKGLHSDVALRGSSFRREEPPLRITRLEN
jgi:hypothetical protein